MVTLQMKYFMVIFAFLGTTLATPSTKSLEDDLQEFIVLIPVAKLKEITCSYKDDSEVQLILQYLKSADFAGLVAAVREKETWIEFKNYLNDAGIEVEAIIAFVHDIITNGVCQSIVLLTGVSKIS